MTKNMLWFLERYDLKLLIEYDAELDRFGFRFVNHEDRVYQRFFTSECFTNASMTSIENILMEETCMIFSLLDRGEN